jgi:hypothetical protein
MGKNILQRIRSIGINPYSNIVLDFDPHPKHSGSYDHLNERIIIRVGHFGSDDEGIECILWVILHESIHVVLLHKFREIYNQELNSEWFQVAGMDYLEDISHDIKLRRPMEASYSKLAPKAFEFRKTFDKNFSKDLKYFP